jgi:hypothetical protein
MARARWIACALGPGHADPQSVDRPWMCRDHPVPQIHSEEVGKGICRQAGDEVLRGHTPWASLLRECPVAVAIPRPAKPGAAPYPVADRSSIGAYLFLRSGSCSCPHRKARERVPPAVAASS